MKPYLIILLAILSLSMNSCSMEELTQVKDLQDGKTVWIFVQFNVPEENDAIDSFWYFGEVSESLYDKIAANKIQQGFLMLENVMYWGDGDEIHEYADEEHTGDLIFRIEDIRRIKLLAAKPKVGKQSNDEEPAEEELAEVENHIKEKVEEKVKEKSVLKQKKNEVIED